ncbi:MAG: DUF763 domain-containing protein, partial [Planctomycetota bacterium]|nr:DUF763 domain-containing protein [Planctomycetota bacterium]
VKEGIHGQEVDLGFFAAGGKGAASRKTPEEILRQADAAALPVDAASLVRASQAQSHASAAALNKHLQIFTSAVNWINKSCSRAW